MSQLRVRVACVGTSFLGDDAFGSEVARRLAPRRMPEWARFADTRRRSAFPPV